jgi:hypothetical protein
MTIAVPKSEELRLSLPSITNFGRLDRTSIEKAKVNLVGCLASHVEKKLHNHFFHLKNRYGNAAAATIITSAIG